MRCKQSSIPAPHDAIAFLCPLQIAVPLFAALSILFVATAPARAQESAIDRLFDPNRVIEVSIEMPVKSWNELRKQTRDPGKVFGGSNENPFTNFKANVTVDGIDIGPVAVRKKGFLGSLDDKYPSLKVKFDEYQNPSSIPGLGPDAE